MSLVVGAGAGTTPDLTTRWRRNPAAALFGTVGVRVRPAHRVVVDATAHGVATLLTGDDGPVVPTYRPGVTYRQRSRTHAGNDAFATAAASHATLVRLGAEVPLNR